MTRLVEPDLDLFPPACGDSLPGFEPGTARCILLSGMFSSSSDSLETNIDGCCSAVFGCIALLLLDLAAMAFGGP